MELDGEVLNGRLVLYADSLALGFGKLIDVLREVGDDLTLVAFDKGTTAILTELTVQIGQAAAQFADDEGGTE